MRHAMLGVVGSSLVLAACAGVKEETRTVPPLYGMDARGAKPSDAAGAPEAPPAAALPAPPVRSRDPHELVRMEFRLAQADGKLVTAPSVSAFAGQRVHITLMSQKSFVQDFDVEGRDGAAIADPIIGVLTEGLDIDALAEEVPGSADEIALAFRVHTAEILDPMPQRQVRPLPSPAQPVTIQVPKIESSEVVGARRVRAGVETEIARLPGAHGGLVLVGTLSRVHVGDPASLLLDLPPADDEPDAAGVSLRRLARVAATGPAAQRLRADAIRRTPAPGAREGDLLAERRDEVVGSIGATTILAPGVRLERSLQESYVRGFEARSGAADPTIATHKSGLWLDVAADGDFEVGWVVTPRFERRAVEVRPGFSIDTEVPVTWHGAAKYPPGTDDRAFGLAIDGDARVHVSFEPLP